MKCIIQGLKRWWDHRKVGTLISRCTTQTEVESSRILTHPRVNVELETTKTCSTRSHEDRDESVELSNISACCYQVGQDNDMNLQAAERSEELIR